VTAVLPPTQPQSGGSDLVGASAPDSVAPVRTDTVRTDTVRYDTVRYDTVVDAVGELIPQFREQGLLVFFGQMAPEELHEFVILHTPTVADSAPEPGDVVELDGEAFAVTSVGHVVAENLLRLGHISLKATGETTAPLPGDVCVEQRELPEPKPGSRLRILTTGVRAATEPAQPPTLEST
jgi:PTS system glucitol/sorbitol-specific IIA component